MTASTSPSASIHALDALRSSYDAAAATAEERRSSFLIGGTRLRLRIRGDMLAQRMTLAFRHLAIPDDGDADLEVRLWDIAATGVGRPIGDLRRIMPEERQFGDGLVTRDIEGQIGYQTPRLSAILDPDGARLIGCVTSTDALSYFETGKPLQPLLFAWHARRDIAPIHAGLIARNGVGLLLGGKGGSGKSTTALSCARYGLDFLGDDYVGLEWGDDGRVTGHSFYASAWLDPEHSHRLDWIGGHGLPGRDSGERKSGFLLSEALPGRLATTTQVIALAIPKVCDDPIASLHPIDTGDALLRLAPSSVLQIPFIDPAMMLGRMARLVRSRPCYELRVGSDLTSIVACVDELLTDLGTPLPGLSP